MSLLDGVHHDALAFVGAGAPDSSTGASEAAAGVSAGASWTVRRADCGARPKL